MKKHPHAVLHRLSLVALAALTACAIVPLQPDLGAKAPELEGFGRSDTPVTTRSDAARRLYHAGVLQAYAFNEKEAVRQFKAALAADPSCAMCAWGVAWQLGPNINAQQRGDLTEARQYIDHALRQAQNASARERALIDAMAARYDVAARAELAAAEHRPDEALAQQARAVAASKEADDEEPPALAAGARLALGDLQLQLGRAADAEATFRDDLAALPNSGWALSGLARALAAQGKPAEAAAVRTHGERAWTQADAALKTRG